MKTRPAFWPLIWTGLIVLGMAICFWQLWHRENAGRERAAAQDSRIAELVKERDELKALLGLPPCETAKRIRLAPEGLPPAKSEVSDSSQELDAIEKACVFLVSTDGRSQLSTGSGFFIAPGYVLTNRHVVEKGTGKAFVTSAAMGSPGLANVEAFGKGKNDDFALLALELPPGANTAVLPFAGAARKTEKVGAWGFPHLVGENDPAYRRLMQGDLSAAPELSYTEGVVSAVLPGELPIIVHTAPISPGNSGGPLLNANGEVIGINSMIQLDSSSYRQASLAIGADALLRFLAEQGIKAGAGKQ